MMMKSSKVKKIIVSLENDSICTYRTSNFILSVGQSVSWLVYVIKVAISEYLIFEKFPWCMPLDPRFRIMLHTMPFVMTLSKGFTLIHYCYNTTGL